MITGQVCPHQKNKEMTLKKPQRNTQHFQNLRKRMKTKSLIKLATIIALILNTTSLGMVFASERVLAQNLESIVVKWEEGTISLGETFDLISERSDFDFFYNPKEVPLNRKTTINNKENLRAMLQDIANQHTLEFKRFKNLIAVKVGVNQVIDQDERTVEEIIISGKVVDLETGQALIGATVKVKGTTIGAGTDIDGNFSLSVPGNVSTLEISYVGYTTKEVEINGESTISISLNPDYKALQDVVVVGYGTQETYRISAAVDQIETEELQIDRRPVSTIESGLVGSIPGLILSQTDGQLGTSMDIQVRMASTLERRSALIMVDGFESSIENINPQDIASVTILKDAAATAIYGARGANGVVLITTKKPSKNQELSVTLNSNYSWQRPAQTADFVNSYEYMTFFNEARSTETQRIGITKDTLFSQDDLARASSGFYPETNWVEELYNETAIQQNHNISVNGGSQKVGYLVSIGYLSQDGISQGPDQIERISARLKLDANVTDWFSTGINVFNSNLNLQRLPLSTQNGIRGQPFYPVKLDTGEYADTYTYKGSSSADENPIAAVNSGSYDERINDELNLQLYGKINPIKNLSIEGKASYVNINNDRTIWSNPYEYIILNEEDLSPVGVPIPFENEDRNLEKRSSRSTAVNTLLKINYEASIGEKHFFQTLFGYQRQSGEKERFMAFRSGFILSELQSLNLGTQIPIDDGRTFGNQSDFVLERSTVSYFGRFSYDYEGKYLLELSGRADASSNFIKDKWAFFPAVSVGWNMHDERFIIDNIDFFSMLKIRASYGLNGDDRDGTGYELVNFNPSGVAFGTSTQPYLTLDQTKNQNLTWETSRKTNIGIDLALWKGKFSLNSDYFIDDRKDVIDNQLTSLESGLTYYDVDSEEITGGIRANAYDAKSWGWEFTAGHKSKLGKVKLEANANLSIYKTKITQGAGDAPLKDDPDNYQKEGLSLSNWFGYETDGFFNSPEEIEGWVNSNGDVIDQSGVVTQGEQGKYLGGYRFVDQNTVDTDGDGIPDSPDGKIDLDDRVVLLSDAFDNLRIGGSVSVGYKGFTLSARIYGVLRGYEWVNSGSNLNAVTGSGVAPYKYQTDTWRPDNQGALFSQAFETSRPYDQNVSGLIVEKDYLKLKNINLNYSLSEKLISKLKQFESIDLYVSFENIGVIWTNYPLHKYGFDPELGADGFNYPLSLKTSIGTRIKF